MRYFTAIVTLAALLTLSSACYRVTVRTPKAPTGIAYATKAHMFIYGLVGADIQAPCDPAAIETKQGVIDWLLFGFTAGIYTPFTVTVYCSADGGGVPLVQ